MLSNQELDNRFDISLDTTSVLGQDYVVSLYKSHAIQTSVETNNCPSRLSVVTTTVLLSE